MDPFSYAIPGFFSLILSRGGPRQLALGLKSCWARSDEPEPTVRPAGCRLLFLVLQGTYLPLADLA